MHVALLDLSAAFSYSSLFRLAVGFTIGSVISLRENNVDVILRVGYTDALVRVASTWRRQTEGSIGV